MAEAGAIDELVAAKTPLPDLAEPSAAARLTLGLRAVLLDDRGADIDLVPALPVAWRGRTIDVLSAPIEGGTLSFGLRWHGPRPALLWEVDAESPVQISARSIDPSFSSTESSGETLLADPGWPRS